MLTRNEQLPGNILIVHIKIPVNYFFLIFKDDNYVQTLRLGLCAICSMTIFAHSVNCCIKVTKLIIIKPLVHLYALSILLSSKFDDFCPPQRSVVLSYQTTRSKDFSASCPLDSVVPPDCAFLAMQAEAR